MGTITQSAQRQLRTALHRRCGPVVLACTVSCHTTAPVVRHAVESRAHSPVVAHLDDEPITADEVAAVAQSEALADPHRALARTIELKLLAREATRRGIDRDPLTQESARRALIQALLARTVEQTAVPSQPPPELSSAIAARSFDLAHGELWQTKHALVQWAGDAGTGSVNAHAAARALAEQIRARVLQVPSGRADRLDAIANEVCGTAPHRVESLPPFDREGHSAHAAFVAPYVQAATQLEQVGNVSPVVETEFGYHVIVLVARVPALERPAAEVNAEVRDELTAWLRHRELEHLLGDLRSRYHVAISDEAARAVDRLDFGAN